MKVMTETMISNDLAYIRSTYVVYKLNKTGPRTDLAAVLLEGVLGNIVYQMC